MKPALQAATVERLPRYIRHLDQVPESQFTISSKDLARITNMNTAAVRKDLSFLGSFVISGGR